MGFFKKKKIKWSKSKVGDVIKVTIIKLDYQALKYSLKDSGNLVEVTDNKRLSNDMLQVVLVFLTGCEFPTYSSFLLIRFCLFSACGCGIFST